jgi:hypothetical protein
MTNESKEIIDNINKEQTGKHILKSKTFWINVVLVLLVPLAPPKVKEYLQPDVVAQLFFVLNVILRAITKEKVYLI